MPRKWGHDAWKQDTFQCGDGDIIEVKLDFHELTLSFKINGNQCGVMNDIEKTKYRACITIIKRAKFKLISYQEIY